MAAFDHYLYAAAALIGTFIAAAAVLWALGQTRLQARLGHFAGVVPPFINVLGVLFGLTLAFLANDTWNAHDRALELARSTDEEKQSQLKRLQDFHARHAAEAPAMLKRLQSAVIDNGNVFEVLMDAVRCCSLGQITHALFAVGGQYRRSM